MLTSMLKEVYQNEPGAVGINTAAPAAHRTADADH